MSKKIWGAKLLGVKIFWGNICSGVKQFQDQKLFAVKLFWGQIFVVKMFGVNFISGGKLWGSYFLKVQYFSGVRTIQNSYGRPPKENGIQLKKTYNGS